MALRRWRISIHIALVTAASLAILAAAGLAAGIWLAPRLLHDALTDAVAQRLGYRLELGRVQVDPWRMSVEFSGARLSARDGTLLATLDRLALLFDADSLWGDTWTLRDVVMVAPRIEISRRPDGTHNWIALFEALAHNDSAPTPRVRVERAIIDRGEVRYRDLSSVEPGETATLHAKQIMLELRGFATYGSAPARLTVRSSLREGAELAGSAEFGWQSRSAAGKLSVRGLPAAALAPWIPLPVSFTRGTLLASARYALRGTARTLVFDELEIAVSDLGIALPEGTASAVSVALENGRFVAAEGNLQFERASLTDFALAQPAGGDPVVAVGNLSLAALSVSMLDRSVRIERAALSGLRGRDAIDARGKSRIAGLLLPGARDAAPAEAAASAPAWHFSLAHFEAGDSAWRVDRPATAGNGESLDAAFGQIAGDALRFAPADAGGFAAERLSATGGALRYARAGAAPRAIELTRVDMSAAQVGYPEGEPFKISAAFGLPPSGNVYAEGEFDPRTLSASLALHADTLPLGSVQSWLNSPPSLRIAAGSLAADGQLRLGANGPGPVARFVGEISVLGIRLEDAPTRNPLFAADVMRATGVKLDFAPVAGAIDELVLQRPAGRIEIAADRSFGFGFPPRAAGKDAEESAAAGLPPLALKKLTLRDGRLDFADRAIRPAVAIRIDELSGTVTGLESSRAATARVSLDGRVGEYGSAKIRGAVQPLAPGTETDMTLELRNVDMTAIDPYSRRFAGYRIEAGKLSGELRYRVQKGRLEGENRLVMEKLKLGERVANAARADLPLELAIALLTDSQGRIRLEIPVRGDLDRPEFDFGEVMAQAISNAIGKIVTAPFRLLASLFGGGGQGIDRILFEPGSARLDPPEREKLDALARALAERPQLAVRVAAGFDAAADAEALRKQEIEVSPAALLALAQARADTVSEALRARGTDPGRIDVAAPQASNAGEKRGVPLGLSLRAR